jgi:DNA-binding response OmpR family regulator
MSNTAEIRALLVTHDHEMVGVFSDLFREIGVAVQSYGDESGAEMGLRVVRFEALVLDFDTLRKTLPIIKSLRDSHSSKNALVFAVASDSDARQRALEQGANFAFERPFQPARIKQVLHTAYGLMLRERRRYFRHAVKLTVRMRRNSGIELQCTTMNISRNGMAVNIPCMLDLGETLELVFTLPDVSCVVTAEGTVVWDDKHGKAGLSFQCASLEHQNHLVGWLDAQFFRHLNSEHGTPSPPPS